MLIRSVDVGTTNFALCDFCCDTDAIHRLEVLAVPTIHSLFAAMDARPFAGHVVIEAQSKRAAKMLAIQHWLQAFYVLKGLKVTIFSARHKLKDSGQENSGRANYRARKKASVALVTAWLKQHPQPPDIHECFEQSKKKDDCADALLQALAFARQPVAVGPVSLPKISCRAPTDRQQRTGKYSQSNLKHIVVKDWKCETEGALAERLPCHKKVAKAVEKHFGSAEECWRALTIA